MAEQYMKAGRGGAGNFYSKQDLVDAAKTAHQDDPEAQSTINDLTRVPTTSNAAPEYLHTGRGGAGNWVQPSSLQSQGLSQAASPNATSTTSVLLPSTNTSQSTQGYNKAIFGPPQRTIGSSKPIYRGGRGGAGNYVDPEVEERMKRERAEAEEKARIEVEKKVERDVEAGLARPPRAYGGAGGAWEMVDMK